MMVVGNLMVNKLFFANFAVTLTTGLGQHHVVTACWSCTVIYNKEIHSDRYDLKCFKIRLHTKVIGTYLLHNGLLAGMI